MDCIVVCRYYYDTETGFYYLQSRYYDPEICRFINADTFATTDIDGLLSTNMFSYCENNPVMGVDYNGKWIQFVVGAVVGAGLEVLTQLATGTKMRDISWADVAIQGAVGAISSGSIAFKAVGKAVNIAANISKNIAASVIGESVSQSINHNKSKGKTVAIGTQATIDTLVDRGSEYLIGTSKAKVAKVAIKIIKNTFSFTYGISIEALFSRNH